MIIALEKILPYKENNSTVSKIRILKYGYVPNKYITACQI